MSRRLIVAGGVLLLGLLGAGGCGSARSSRASDAQAPARPAATGAKPPPNVSPFALPAIEVPGPAVAACREGDARECWHAARLYLDGWGIPRDMVRVALYGGLACSSGIREACALMDFAYLSEKGRKLPPGLSDYKERLDEFDSDTPPSAFCLKEPPAKDRWGWALYYWSNCALATMGSDPTVLHYDESDRVSSACLQEGDGEACLGMAMARSDNTDASNREFASICRRKGLVCDIAVGDTDEETARFREQACLGRRYQACHGWAFLADQFGRPVDARLIARISVEVCIHPDPFFLPTSFVPSGEPNRYVWGCEPSDFASLAASQNPDDQALLSTLSHWPEEIRAADCTGRFYDAHACALFVNDLDHDHLGLKEHRVPEEVRWKERMEALKSMCEKPPPFEADKPTIARLCSDQASIEKEYKKFLAAHPPKGPRP